MHFRSQSYLQAKSAFAKALVRVRAKVPLPPTSFPCSARNSMLAQVRRILESTLTSTKGRKLTDKLPNCTSVEGEAPGRKTLGND